MQYNFICMLSFADHYYFLKSVQWRCLNEVFGFLSKHFRLLRVSRLDIIWLKDRVVSVIVTGNCEVEPSTPSCIRSAWSFPPKCCKNRALVAAPLRVYAGQFAWQLPHCCTQLCATLTPNSLRPPPSTRQLYTTFSQGHHLAPNVQEIFLSFFHYPGN